MENKIETLLGGMEVQVLLEDGVKEQVKVRQLAIKHFPKLLELQGDEIAMAGLYCERGRDWAEKLSAESHETIIVEGERLNADFFSRWFQRQQSRIERVRPGLVEKLMNRALESQESPKPKVEEGRPAGESG